MRSSPRGVVQRRVWFFDLDNTLHDASHAVFPAINRLMTSYVARVLGVSEQEAAAVRVDYWRRYGATLLGMQRHHQVDAAEFLRESHAFEDLPAMLRAERGLRMLFRRLPGRKVLVTNAPLDYASQVLAHLKLARHFDRTVSIEHMQFHRSFRPKPARSLMLHLAARERVKPASIILVDDALPNLKSARACGMATVRVLSVSAVARVRGGHKPAYVSAQVHSAHQLLRLGFRFHD